MINGLPSLAHALDWSLSRWWLMENPVVCFTLIEVFIKKTLYHLICFSYVQKVFIPLLSRLKIMAQSEVFLYARMALGSLICSLLMTTFFFVGQTTMIVELSWKCLTNMSRRQANKLTVTKRRFVSAPTWRDRYKNPLKLCSELRPLPNMKNIWVFHHLWEEQKNRASAILGWESSIRCKGGRKNSYPKQVEKFSSRRWYKPCQLSLWIVSNSLGVYARIYSL